MLVDALNSEGSMNIMKISSELHLVDPLEGCGDPPEQRQQLVLGCGQLLPLQLQVVGVASAAVVL